MGFGNLFNLDKIIDAKVEAKLEVKLADTIKNQVAEQIAVNTDNRTQIVQYGMTQTEAKEYLYLLYKQNLLPILRDEARKEAEQRVLEFQKGFLLKADKELSETDFNKFADPDVQFITNKAVETVARYNREDLNNVLSDLIIDRLKTDDDFEKIVISDAIQILPRLTSNQLKLITIKSLFDYNTASCQENINSWKELNDFLNITLSYFLDIDYSTVAIDTLHIVSTGAASAPGLGSYFSSALAFKYAYLFYKPIRKESIESWELSQETINMVFDQASDIELKIKPEFKNTTVLKSLLKDKIMPEELNKIKNVIANAYGYASNAEQTIIENLDFGDNLTRLWKSGFYGSMKLTSVGHLIASILYKKFTEIKVDWKDYED